MSKRRTWLWVLFGVCIVLFFLGIGALIVTQAWMRENVTVTDATEGGAQREFDAVKTRFGTRPPLLDMRNGRPVYTGGKPPDTAATPVSLENLHVLVWDPEDSKLATVAIPFWLLRLKSGPIEFGAYASGFDDEGVKLRPEDIEKHGPGIILDMTSPRGERVLLWAQ
jgi:hypothetical protein